MPLNTWSQSAIARRGGAFRQRLLILLKANTVSNAKKAALLAALLEAGLPVINILVVLLTLTGSLKFWLLSPLAVVPI